MFHIWRIEPTAHGIYSGQKTSVLAFCRVLLPVKHSYKATLEGKNPILLQSIASFLMNHKNKHLWVSYFSHSFMVGQALHKHNNLNSSSVNCF